MDPSVRTLTLSPSNPASTPPPRPLEQRSRKGSSQGLPSSSGRVSAWLDSSPSPGSPTTQPPNSSALAVDPGRIRAEVKGARWADRHSFPVQRRRVRSSLPKTPLVSLALLPLSLFFLCLFLFSSLTWCSAYSLSLALAPSILLLHVQPRQARIPFRSAWIASPQPFSLTHPTHIVEY